MPSAPTEPTSRNPSLAFWGLRHLRRRPCGRPALRHRDDPLLRRGLPPQSGRPASPRLHSHPRPPRHRLLHALVHGPQREPDSQLRRHAASSPHPPGPTRAGTPAPPGRDRLPVPPRSRLVGPNRRSPASRLTQSTADNAGAGRGRQAPPRGGRPRPAARPSWGGRRGPGAWRPACCGSAPPAPPPDGSLPRPAAGAAPTAAPAGASSGRPRPIRGSSSLQTSRRCARRPRRSESREPRRPRGDRDSRLLGRETRLSVSPRRLGGTGFYF